MFWAAVDRLPRVQKSKVIKFIRHKHNPEVS